MTARTPGTLLVLAALALLVSLVGCGGGGSSTTAPPVNDTLFVPNYVNQLDNGLFHWDHLPMTVSFTFPSNWQQIYPTGQNLHNDAANEWNQEGKQQMIRVVPAGTSADATVSFVPQSQLGGDIRGMTEYVHDTAGYMHDATVRIALDTKQGGLISAGDAQETIAHELGHALGIGGHSNRPDDLMYWTHYLGTMLVPTVYDMNTVMTAYPSYFGRFLALQLPGSRADNGPLIREVIE